MDKIRVLHIITRLDPGGSSTNTIETVARMNPERFTTVLISGRTHDPDLAIEASLKARGIAYLFLPNIVREINPWRDIVAFCQLFIYLKQHRFDIVHTHTSKAGILGRWAAWVAGVPVIIHTPHGHVFYGYFGTITTKIFIWVERLTAHVTHKIITLTKRGAQEHVDFKIAPREKFVTIYSGIDVPTPRLADVQKQQALKDVWHIPEDRFIFGTVARLAPIKGIHFLIEAIAQLKVQYPYIHLVIVGDGQERARLRELCEHFEVSGHVSFVGYQQRPMDFIELMDVFVLSSLNEGMGRVILEAMALSKTVIATRVGGIPEIVLDQQTGFIVEPGNAKALSLAMQGCINDKTRVKTMGEQARLSIGKRFSLAQMVEDIQHLYEQEV